MTTLVTLVTLVIAIPAIMYNLYSPKKNILTIIGQRENSKENNNPFESHAYNLHIFFFSSLQKNPPTQKVFEQKLLFYISFSPYYRYYSGPST